ncbi:MAG: sulfotransferase [Solirubrobacterales bacterium]
MNDHPGPPAEQQPPVLGGEHPERAPELAPIVFVGGTGRSGTHVLAQVISRNRRFGLVPVEVRFHTDPDGFPGLLAGEVELDRFVKRLRGYWWRGFQTRRMRGLFRFVDRERFDAAVERFEAGFAEQREEACRRLFYDLLWFRSQGRPEGEAIVEQSCDTVAQAETLVGLFPEARFIHVVRDGRDASASRVAQTRGLVRPRTRVQGIEWWEERMRAIEAGARAIPDGRLLTMSLDELLQVERKRVALRPMFRFLGAQVTRGARRYLRQHMSPEQAHSERWRAGLSDRKAARIEALYAEALDRLEAEGAPSAPLLRRTFERDRAGDRDLEPIVYVYDRPSA